MREIVKAGNNALSLSASTSELVDDWHASLELRVKAGELAANTAVAYKRSVGKFVTWCSSAGTTGMNVDILRTWKAAMLAEGKRPATINAWLAGIKALFSWATENGRIPFNPTQGIKGATRKGTNKKHARESLTDLEVKRLLAQPDNKTLEGKRDLAILALMLFTGIRTVEVQRADLKDLRTEGGRLVLYVTGKGHSEADELVVIASEQAQNSLYDWLSVRGRSPGALFLSLSDRSKGKRLSTSALRHLIKAYFNDAGILGNKSTHSLRHTAITKVIMKSGSVQKARSVARHRSIDTTMVYFHELDRLENPGESFIDYGG